MLARKKTAKSFCESTGYGGLGSLVGNVCFDPVSDQNQRLEVD
jgi:hypothetical protein